LDREFLAVSHAVSCEDLTLVVMNAAGISASARMVLLCLIGLLLVILGFLIAFAVLIRRRPAADVARTSPRREGRSASEGARVGVAVTGGLAVARSETMGCPTCRRQYDAALDYCPRDARKLVPSSRLEARAGGSVCTACRRGFDPGTRFCPHDGSELVGVAVYEATRSDVDAEPTGVMAKICPQCRSRHDLAATYCGRDGSELVAIN
jgi:hypothetical protein